MPVSRSAGFRRNLLPYLPKHLESASTYTYAVWDGESVKIGKSINHPHVRLATLQTGSSRQLHLLAYSASITEAQAHRRLSSWRTRGEWFRARLEVLDYVAGWCWVDAAVLASARQNIARPAALLEENPTSTQDA